MSGQMTSQSVGRPAHRSAPSTHCLPTLTALIHASYAIPFLLHCLAATKVFDTDVSSAFIRTVSR